LRRAIQILVLSSVASLAWIACEHTSEFPAIKEPLKLKSGTVVSTERLESGREAYMLYCRPCHGENGDGRGPAGIGLRPPPRNFTAKYPNGEDYNLVFKFGGVEAGSLPPDSELKRIVKKGLHGTAMLPWAVPDNQLDDILQYIKTFNPIWTSDDVATPIEITADPWKGKEEEGTKRGKIVYHGLAQCLKCHPAYATKQEIWDAVKEATGEGSTSAFREDMYNPDAKLSEAFRVKLLPPDFIRHDVKAGTTPEDLFRTIASGIGGTAMPMWKTSIDDSDIWAIAHFVNSLVAIKDTPQAAALRKKLVEQPPWTAPAEGGAEGAKPGQ
jgi:mono/diheme cytochrome c family protein